jgi:hypothetical protein
VQLSPLVVEGCLLVGELIMVLSCPPLDVDLSGVGLRLLLLLIGLLLIGEGLHSWLRCRRSHSDCQDGLESWSALRDQCGDDEVRRGHHVAPSGAGGS